MAPAKASAPPTSHVVRKSHGFGTLAAMRGGVKRMPPPMTLETMMAAASRGPSRRSSVCAGVAVVVGTGGLSRLKAQGSRLKCARLKVQMRKAQKADLQVGLLGTCAVLHCEP